METSPLVKLACSVEWQGIMGSWLKTACDLETAGDNKAAKWALRRALAIERLHRMVVSKAVPMFSLTKQAWIPLPAPEKGTAIAA